ncbi:MAG: hypothetical protein IJ453_02070 [Oscillospiraceae bacterium]|nr:hypothetical protein [Oscillospiraceae bacterium]
MESYYRIFRKYLQSRNVIFTDIESDILMMEYRGEAMEKIPLLVHIPTDETEKCLLICPEVVKIIPEVLPEALKIVNLMNKCAPVANIHIDDDNAVVVTCCVPLHREYFCEDIMKTLRYLAEAADGTYMQFQEEMEFE